MSFPSPVNARRKPGSVCMKSSRSWEESKPSKPSVVAPVEEGKGGSPSALGDLQVGAGETKESPRGWFSTEDSDCCSTFYVSAPWTAFQHHRLSMEDPARLPARGPTASFLPNFGCPPCPYKGLWSPLKALESRILGAPWSPIEPRKVSPLEALESQTPGALESWIPGAPWKWEPLDPALHLPLEKKMDLRV